jgi:prepilin-type processing-associated H-X9-DG protein
VTEVLVVLAVVAVLMVLALPVYQAFALQGLSAKSVGQLRSIATAGLSWVADNQGRLPDQTGWYSRSKSDPRSLFGYLGLPNTGAPVLHDSVFTCPVFQKSFPTRGSSPHRTYAINRYATGSHVGDPADWSQMTTNADPPQTLLRVRSPGRMAFFMDGRPNTLQPRDNYVYRSYAATDSIAPDKTPHLHQGGLHVAFLDGHVKRITTDWIEQEQLAVSSRRVHPFWGAGK